MTSPAEVRIQIPRHAMGMLIGTKGANFRDIQDIPELSECNLEQPRTSGGGVLTAQGSVRACAVAADRVGRIIDASYERNVKQPSAAAPEHHAPYRPPPGPARARYERPSVNNRAARRHDPIARRSATPDGEPEVKPKAPAEDSPADEKRDW